LGNPENPFGSFIINCRGPEHFPVNINSGEYVNHGSLGVLLFLSVRSPKKTILIGLFSPLKNRRNIENWRYSGKKFKMAVPIYPCLTLCLKIRLLIKHPSLCCETCNSADGSTGCVSACVRITWISWACSGYDGIS
jgi:hypothetical protein